MRENKEALVYFVGLMKEGKIKYNDGRLFRCWEPRRNWLSEAKRAEKKTRNGYYMLRANVKENGKYFSVMAHRVIWSYFNGPIPDGMEINHKNGFKSNNCIENLELVTRSGNRQHAKRNGLLRPAKGLESGRGKLSDNDVREIRVLLAQGVMQKDIALCYNVRPNQISRINTGARRGEVMQVNIEVLNDYQIASSRTMVKEYSYDDAMVNYSMGLIGESGEVIDLLKKSLFHGHELDRNKLKEELGDVLFYIAALATTVGVTLEEIANYNIDKLWDRYPNGFTTERSINRDIEPMEVIGK